LLSTAAMFRNAVRRIAAPVALRAAAAAPAKAVVPRATSGTNRKRRGLVSREGGVDGDGLSLPRFPEGRGLAAYVTNTSECESLLPASCAH